jgi:tRNA G18 (ribose-2'-O)-methylase SpoU
MHGLLMLPHVSITTLEIPALAPYRTLRRPVDHQRLGIFVAEGTKVVERLLTSQLEVISCLLTHEWLERYEDLLRTRSPMPALYVGDKALLEQIVGFHLHQGAMAVGRIPAANSIDDLAADMSRPLLLVALDGMTNAENVGVLVRNCAAFGVDGLIVGETSSSPYLRRAVRNSMGTVFALPVLRSEDLAGTLTDIGRRLRVRTIAAHPAASQQIREGSLSGERLCLVFGSEGHGLSAPVLAACSTHVSIPMASGVDSLNVASATAVFLYEASRGRKARQAP